MTDRKTSADKDLSDFLAEAEEIVDQLVSELGELADCSERNDVDPDLVNSIFRAAHSLKGLSGMFGFNIISELSHNIESLLESLRLGKVILNSNVLNVLFESTELLNILIRSVSEGNNQDFTKEISASVASINACQVNDHIAGENSPLLKLGLSDRVLSSLTEYEEHRLKDNMQKGKNIFSIHVSFEMSTFDQELTHISDLIKTCGELISTLPGIGENIETHIDFDLLFSSSNQLTVFNTMPEFQNISLSMLHSSSNIHPVISSSNHSLTGMNPPVLTASDDFELPEPAVVAAETLRSSKSMSKTVRVDIGKLDELMNIVGELVQSHSSISGLAISMRKEGFSHVGIELGKATKSLERKLADLQKSVMEIRLVPVGQLYEKMSRIVRQISREQGKKVDLAFFGAETELDKLLIEDISDPMMHIIRNAIDHGIEMPDHRLKLGKAECGTISISSSQKGNHVVIEIADDGNGIDIEGVKKRALERGLVSDVSKISDKDALEIIFLPGFSTAETVSAVSGRGVGMDVVKNNISAISGLVDVETNPGIGSRFIITLPITLAIIKVLIVSSASRIYAMPISSVQETLLLKKSDIETIEQNEVVTLRNSTLPLIQLDRYLGFKPYHDKLSGDIYAVVVGIAEKRIGIVVDELLGQQDVVIKPLGDAFKGYHGISGAADLGEQGTILVLDTGAILNESRKSGN